MLLNVFGASPGINSYEFYTSIKNTNLKNKEASKTPKLHVQKTQKTPKNFKNVTFKILSCNALE